MTRAPQSHRLVPIPQRLDGSGLVWIGCQQRTAELFRMDRFPEPEALFRGSAEVVRRRMRLQVKSTARQGTPYRIAYGRRIAGHRHQSAVIRLSACHRRETLAVLCRLLDGAGAQWHHLCDLDNQPLDLAIYRAAA